MEDDEERLNSAVKAAQQLLTWRHALQENLDPAASTSEAVNPGGSDSNRIEGSGEDGSDAIQYTPASGYRSYILLTYQVLGVRAKFRAVQEIVHRVMVKEGVLLPLDEQKTDGTGSPCYMANSRSHRAALVRRGLLTAAPQGRFALTEAGGQFVQRWLTDRGPGVERYEHLIRGPRLWQGEPGLASGHWHRSPHFSDRVARITTQY